MRVSLHTLGCKLNYADTGSMSRAFEERGFDAVPWGGEADVAVINTCTVTEEAERKCRQAIRRALRLNPDTYVIVTGCYAQLRPEEIAEIEGVDLVLGTAEKSQVFAYADAFVKQEKTQVHVSCIDEATDFGPSHAAGERSRAFLKVQDGCDYSCSFCTIPAARGPSRSHTIAGAVAQARSIARDGFSEIVLSGVNIGLFGQDTGESLLDLFRALDTVDGVARYRISSIEPNLLTDEIIGFVAGSRAFQPHFHIPLQSGDDEVLGAMRRRYRRQVYADRVGRIRRDMPHACIGVDVIVGFPAETDAHFRNTAAFLEDLDVSYLHVFTYSERPDTVAVERFGTDVVNRGVRSQRNRTLRLLSTRKRMAFNARFVGTSRPVLWEREGEMHQLGFTDNYVRVRRASIPGTEGAIEQAYLDRLAEDGVVEAGIPALTVL
ncbi:MAG: tRNA (N(6)-L-threonylcarbamoyladenosine(37)-C(2))-methylthiotransferase MtaB [Rhodothermales bacterium]|nr:tRNA (N(6)-L-threonylcarbamoyladenosine(37)-C(2))-methylthiotransferase MtaB [Rhodothermales bacterium]MBO6780214.1 tRNA (N(6)-L-threonylcarbamoyladenosine(37)-C(2))-methylthiotransferase MtaB [Rhodothermales bacterium]